MRYRHLTLYMLVTLFLHACSVDVRPPEEMVRERIEEGRTYAANRELSKLVGMVSDDFTATRGIDRSNLKSWMTRFYLAGESTQVFVRIKEITADWETARATILMGTTNLSLGDLDLDRFRGRLLYMELHFRFVDDAWMVTRADWRDAKPGDLTLF